MSSHHVIRENQEPALLVLGLDDFPDELLRQLLEWSPTVMATESMAENLASRGVKIDRIIGNEKITIDQADIKYTPVYDDNITATALTFLTENEYPSVNIVADVLKLDDILPFIGKIDIVIFYSRQKIYPVSSGFNKWKPKSETIVFYGRPLNLRVSGLKKVNALEYKTIADGFFSLCFDEPFMFVAEPI